MRLLRCRREDDLARESFQLVREDLRLWVLELPDRLEDVVSILSELKLLLSSLKEGSLDYVLHLSLHSDQRMTLQIPPELTSLSLECGFLIEIAFEIE